MNVTGEPVAAFQRNAELMIAASRELAWSSQLDSDTMEHMLRRIANRAQRRLFASLMPSPAND